MINFASVISTTIPKDVTLGGILITFRGHIPMEVDVSEERGICRSFARRNLGVRSLQPVSIFLGTHINKRLNDTCDLLAI